MLETIKPVAISKVIATFYSKTIASARQFKNGVNAIVDSQDSINNDTNILIYLACSFIIFPFIRQRCVLPLIYAALFLCRGPIAKVRHEIL